MLRGVVVIRKLLSEKISWIEKSGKAKWWASCLGKKCELTMNNFPEEPLYTVRCDGESMDIDDLPPNWSVP